MCQGFSHFPGFLHRFLLAKLASSSLRVKPTVDASFLSGKVTGSFLVNSHGWASSPYIKGLVVYDRGIIYQTFSVAVLRVNM